MNIITLCGSSKFKPIFNEIEKSLCLKGNIVLSLNIFSHYDNIKLSKKEKKLLDNIHLEKIKISNEIFIINKNGYIGKSTLKEINFAKNLNKKIIYLE